MEWEERSYNQKKEVLPSTHGISSETRQARRPERPSLSLGRQQSIMHSVCGRHISPDIAGVTLPYPSLVGSNHFLKTVYYKLCYWVPLYERRNRLDSIINRDKGPEWHFLTRWSKWLPVITFMLKWNFRIKVYEKERNNYIFLVH